MYRVLLVLTFAGACLAQPSEEAVKKELKAFQGKWKAVSAHNLEGKPLDDDELKKTRLTVDGNKFSLTTGDSTIDGTFAIDPSKKIKTIDVFEKGQDKPLVLGIYEIVGDKRRSCFAEPGKDRPDKFRKEKGYLFLEWQRDK